LKTVIIGIGNLLRCDDGAGPHVINILKEMKPALNAFDLTMPSIDIIELIKGYDKAIIIDAVKTGAEPGTIFNVNISQEDDQPIVYSSHGVDLFTTLKLGEELYGDELPDEIIVYGIEIQDVLSFDMECTPSVDKAVKKVVHAILETL